MQEKMQKPAWPFVFAIGWGAFLLFQLQPMLAKPLLPILGGAPLVWQVCMMMFQALLLGGYAYAFWLTRQPVARQWKIHLVLWGVALASLFWPLPAMGVLDPAVHPVFWLIQHILLQIGLPFLVLSATTPLVQRWAVAHRPAIGSSVFRLYVASNFGSLLGLLSYPFLIEPWFTLIEQRQGMMLAFLLQALIIIAASLTLRRVPALMVQAELSTAPVPSLRRQAEWVWYAALGCSLMLGVTHYLSMDVASIPLLWILPLALYLVSFMVAFAVSPQGLDALHRNGAAFVFFLLLLGLIAIPSLWMILPILLLMFVLCTILHHWLAAAQPATEHAARYYLAISLGGVLAGVFNGILAPLLFDRVIEHMLTLLAILAVFAWRAPLREDMTQRKAMLWIGFALILLMGGALLVPAGTDQQHLVHPQSVMMLGALVIFLSLYLRRPEWRWAQSLPIVMMTLFALAYQRSAPDLLFAGRSWFGTMRVTQSKDGEVHNLVQGTTLHGLQAQAPEKRRDVLSYYAPLKMVWKALPASLHAKPFAIVGLGAGTLACLDGGPHPSDLYEIDPLMVEVAQNPKYFSYMEVCGAQSRVLMGDGRLSMQQVEDGRYGLIVLDAFSSDMVPIHLMTREAVALYLKKLAPGGMIAFHVSNRYLDLVPVLNAVASELQLQAIHIVDRPEGIHESRHLPSNWMILSPDVLPQEIWARQFQQAKKLEQGDPSLLWTDDYSALWRALK